MSTEYLSQGEKLALDNCDREPIHIPGRIQAFGTILAGPGDLSRIDYVGANSEAVLGDGMTPARVLGSSFVEILGSRVVHDARNTLSLSTSRHQRERVGRIERPGTGGGEGDVLEIFAHRNPAGLAVIECEPVPAITDTARVSPVDQMRQLLAQASGQNSLIKLLRVSAHGLRAMTGYDRVKAYRYFSNGDGEVVAESRSPAAPSFLGLRYPAWDVPQQARALQVKNPLRMLSDIKAEPVPLLAAEDGLPPLDISLAHTRGISPIHVEYLGNMGVAATLTLGIIVDGKLWGMFAFHHMSPKTIGSELRIAVELFGQLISLVIRQQVELDKATARMRAGEARREILAETDATTDLLHAFPKLGPILARVVEADGLAVTRDDVIQSLGSVPPNPAIRKLMARRAEDENLLEGTDNLSGSGWTELADLGHSAGCLQIRCTAAYPLQLMFFRDEKIRDVKWAGAPEKDVSVGPMGARLTPRGSFAAYAEEQSGYARDWDVSDLEAGRELQILLTQITAKGERAQMIRHKDLVTHQRQQDLMIAELNHRVKNILALIRSLSRQAKASSASLESYADALEKRISALAAAHDLAVSESMAGVSLRGILETELQPYLGDTNMQVLLSGPVIGLRADVAPMIALVFHEIVTNAAKYGALSDPDGIVRAVWTVGDNGLSFKWRELGGPEVQPPTRHGFGRALIEKAIPYEFDGHAALDYPPTGVTFDFSLPSDTLVDLTEDTHVKVVGRISDIEVVAKGKSALLVEDNLVLAMDMVESLTRLGAETVATAGSIDEAMALVSKQTFDFAVLDMNLRGTVTFDIGRALTARGTPYIFVTGYGSSITLPAEIKDVAVLTKPVDDQTLSSALGKILSE